MNKSSDFLSASRKVKILSDAELFMDEEQINLARSVDFIFDLNSETFEKVYNLIKNSKDNLPYLINAVSYASRVRPAKQKDFIKLLNLLLKERSIIPLKTSPFYSRIHKFRKITVDIDLDKYFESVKEGSLQEIIKNDDVERFVKISERKNFAPMFDRKTLDTKFLEDVDSLGKQISCINVIAFYGAIKCFKAVSLNEKCDFTEANKFAVAGGNMEIIKTLEQKGYSFDGLFKLAIKFHQNEVCDWLLTNYKCEKMEIDEAVKYFNDRLFFFNVNNTAQIDPNIINEAFLKSIRTENINLVKYISKNYKINMNPDNYNGKMPTTVAAKRNNLTILKYLIKKCHAQTNPKKANSPLFAAVKNSSAKIVKYLIKRHHVDVEKAERYGFGDYLTPLQVAAQAGNFEIFKILIKNGKASPTEDYLYSVEDGYGTAYQSLRSVLFYAAKGGNLDIVKYLVEKERVPTEDEFQDESETILREPALKAAIENGRFDIVKYFFEKCHFDPGLELTVFEDGRRGNIETSYYFPAEIADNCGNREIEEYIKNFKYIPKEEEEEEEEENVQEVKTDETESESETTSDTESEKESNVINVINDDSSSYSDVQIQEVRKSPKKSTEREIIVIE